MWAHRSPFVRARLLRNVSSLPKASKTSTRCCSPTETAFLRKFRPGTIYLIFPGARPTRTFCKNRQFPHTWRAKTVGSTTHPNQLTPWRRVFPEKLTVTQLVTKCPTFYGTLRFTIVFTRPYHCSLSWARCNQSTPSHIIFPRSILILPSHLRLGLPNGLFP